MTSDQDIIATNLHMLSIEEVVPASAYRCRRCHTTWTYRDLPEWWRCPTVGCVAGLASDVPAIAGAMRQLTARRPVPVPGTPPVRRRGGRPRGPLVPPQQIRTAFEMLFEAQGRYPSDKDLADKLEVTERTIQNYRTRGYLPPRPEQSPSAK